MALQTAKEVGKDPEIKALYGGEEKPLKRGQVGCDGVG